MSHMNEILQLLDNIIVSGESMAKIGKLLKEFIAAFAEAIPQKSKTAQVIEAKTVHSVTTDKKDEPANNPYTFADVRKAFSAKSHAGYTAQVKELIGKYGADRLSDIKESDYPSLMADLEVIG